MNTKHVWPASFLRNGLSDDSKSNLPKVTVKRELSVAGCLTRDSVLTSLFQLGRRVSSVKTVFSGGLGFNSFYRESEICLLTAKQPLSARSLRVCGNARES